MFSANERGAFGIDFELGTAAAALGEEDVGDVVERIDACDLMDFLHDEVNGLGVGKEDDVDAGSWENFFARRRAIAAVAIVAAFEGRAAIAVAWGAVVAVPLATVVAALGFFTCVISAGLACGLFGCGLGPSRTEGKTGHQTAQWIILWVAHGGDLSGRSGNDKLRFDTKIRGLGRGIWGWNLSFGVWRVGGVGFWAWKLSATKGPGRWWSL